jgi:Ca2+-transporting ATPase
MDSYDNKFWHSMSLDDIYAELGSSADGISEIEASLRLQANGNNELIQKPPKTIWQMLKSQIIDPMIIILIFASLFSFILKEWTEAIVILVIVVINSIIGIVQEKKAQASIEALRNMSMPTTRVVRQGEEKIVPSVDLVVGDIVLLADGDMVPADIRLIDSANLKVQESALTGESVPSQKNHNDILQDSTLLGDRSNMVYTSSIVVYGRGKGIVVATGMDTEVGKIAGMLNNQDELDTPLKKKLNSVGKVLTIVGILACVLVLIIGVLYNRPFVPQLLLAVSLAISVIPEGLPATATVVMALGVKRMAKKNALIRNLPAVETLGGATVICSDKTGTLTLNKMTVEGIMLWDNLERGDISYIEEYKKAATNYCKNLIYCAALCNDAVFNSDNKDDIIGDPTEGALIVMAKNFGIDSDILKEKYPRLFEQPFDSERKRMTTVHQTEEGFIGYTKGAVDEMLPLCNHILTPTGVKILTDVDKEKIKDLCEQMSQKAWRVLGFAMKKLSVLPVGDSENIETDLIFLGAVGMIDPPRKEVIESIRTCHKAGIETIMITGDHKSTAVAIAKDLGIYQKGNTVLSGNELEIMSDDELDKALKTTTVFARVSPADKLRIIKSLRRNGEVAAMTGDGVNDSPALKAADIGVAMGITGTDVAKDASDMILLDDSFTTIAYAIKEGRRVYRNIQKVIQFLLVGNIAEIITLSVATLLNWDAPLSAIHLLWTNLATATLPGLALGVDPADKHIMEQPPVKSGTLFEKDLVYRVITQGIFVALITTIGYWVGISMGNYAVGQTMAFCVLSFSQMLRAFNQRSDTEPIWVRAEGINPWLIVSFIVSLLLMLCILFIPFFQGAFRVTELSGIQWLIVIGLSLLSIVQVEVVKLFKHLKRRFF